MISMRFSREDQLYTVGIMEMQRNGEEWWIPIRDCKSREEAAAWMSYLNGGVHPNEIEGYWSRTYWQDNAEKAMR